MGRDTVITSRHYAALHHTYYNYSALRYNTLFTLHSTALHSTKPRYIKLRYTILHKVQLQMRLQLHSPLHYTPHYTTLNYTTLTRTIATTTIALLHATLHYTTLRYLTLPCTTFTALPRRQPQLHYSISTRPLNYSYYYSCATPQDIQQCG